MEMISVCGGSSDLQHTILRKSPAGERVPSGLRPAFEVTLLTTWGRWPRTAGTQGRNREAGDGRRVLASWKGAPQSTDLRPQETWLLWTPHPTQPQDPLGSSIHCPPPPTAVFLPPGHLALHTKQVLPFNESTAIPSRDREERRGQSAIIDSLCIQPSLNT